MYLPSATGLTLLVFEFMPDEEMAKRGVKRAGNKVAEKSEGEMQIARERGVLMVTYLNDADIPESPSEPYLEELVKSQSVPPKIIPLPAELRNERAV